MSAIEPESTPTAAQMRARFDASKPHTVGIEEELMLLDPATLELEHCAPEIVALLGDDARFKVELPASQLEIVTAPSVDLGELADALMTARLDLAARTAGIVKLCSAGVHPFSRGSGVLNQMPQYHPTIREYGPVAERQLVCAFQVHVSVGDADCALAVYNAARSYLPLLAALAANAPFYEGRDTGLASVRPKIGGLLPRQGVPPAFSSWDEYAAGLGWGASTQTFGSARWWWELRLHPRWGTLEFRVPDGQSTVADGIAIAAVIQALVAWLSERYRAGERLPVAPSWRVDENRWSACRHGVEGTMADLDGSGRRPTRDHLDELFTAIEPAASQLGSRSRLESAHALAACNGAMRQRLQAGRGGARAAAAWLTECFLEP